MQTLEPLTIFYTDDDPDDQQLFKEVLAEIGGHHHIFTQNHGEELMNMLKNPPPSPHIVFLDLNMPVKNGYEVLKEIRNSDSLQTTPVVVFTTSDDKDSIAMTKNLGADMFVSKPASYSQYKKTLGDLISKNWTISNRNGQDFIYHS